MIRFSHRPHRPAALLQTRQLQALIAVGEDGSVHAAARSLGMPQPGLSRLIAGAEAMLGVKLFDRSRAGSLLTAGGKRVLQQSIFALRSLERVSEAAAESPPGVRIGCIPRAMHVLMPHLLERIIADPPRFRLHVSVGTSTELIADLCAARVDYAIARRVPQVGADGPALDADRLYNERTVVVCASGNKSVPTSVAHMKQLSALSWLLPKPGYHSRDLIDQIMLAAGLPTLVPIIESNSFESSLSVVAHTEFVSIAPEFAASRFERLGLVRIVRTRPALGSSPVMLLYRGEQRDEPASAAFRKVALDAARRRRLA